MPSPYDVLGVKRGATREEIDKAYRELAGRYDFDYYGNHPLADEAKRRMEEINEAYDQLTLGGVYQEPSQNQGGSNQYGQQFNVNHNQGYNYDPRYNQGTPYYRGGGGRSCCGDLACCCLADSCCECCGGDLIACC